MPAARLSIETALASRRSPNEISFYGRYSVLKERVLSVEYSMTMARFPGGNDHGPKHIERVLQYLDKILAPKPLKHLSEYELFLAMMGVLYHDIGMLRGRDGHAEMSAKLLAEDQADYVFSDIDKVFLKEVVRSHSSSKRIEDCQSDQHVQGYDVRPQTIAALVRIADELDEDIRRADRHLQAKLELPAESTFYWRFNQCVRGVKVDRESRDVVFNLAFDREDVGRQENGINSTFLQSAFRKIAKVNKERRYCNSFLPNALRLRSVQIKVHAIPQTPFRGATLVLDDDAGPDALDRILPPVLLDLSEVRSGKRHKASAQQRASKEFQADNDEVVVNGYKLFYHRTSKRLSVRELAERSGVASRIINTVEWVREKLDAPDCFRTLPQAQLDALERTLGCAGRLRYGQGDDLLAQYLLFYQMNRRGDKQRGRPRSIDANLSTKAIVFDFGGTLTKSTSQYSTWERLWMSVGYSIRDAGALHHKFSQRRLTHQEWCDETCAALRARGFSRSHLEGVLQEIEPVEDLQETVTKLHARGLQLFIVSGSVREIIARVLDTTFHLFSDVKANEMVFDESGLLHRIRGHDFDFEGKAEFIRRVAKEVVKCEPLQVLFIGNSLNDSHAYSSGARTLCVNPAHVNFEDTERWTDYIREMKSLREIERYTGLG